MYLVKDSRCVHIPYTRLVLPPDNLTGFQRYYFSGINTRRQRCGCAVFPTYRIDSGNIQKAAAFCTLYRIFMTYRSAPIAYLNCTLFRGLNLCGKDFDFRQERLTQTTPNAFRFVFRPAYRTYLHFQLPSGESAYIARGSAFSHLFSRYSSISISSS